MKFLITTAIFLTWFITFLEKMVSWVSLLAEPPVFMAMLTIIAKLTTLRDSNTAQTHGKH